MQVKFSYKNVEPKEKNFLEDYWLKKQGRFKTLLNFNEFNNAHLEIRAERFVKKDAFKVEIFLTTPTINLMAGEDDHTIVEAFDLALDKLIIQLRKIHDKKTKDK